MKPFYRLVALPLTALSLCATARAAEMYYNRLPLDQVIPAGAYGDITVPSPGYAATKFGTDVAEIPASAGNVGGAYAPIIQKVGSDTDTQTHTVAGWFKLTKKADAETILWAALTYVTSKDQAGYKVAVTKDGKLTVGKTNYPIASYGTQISSTSTVPDGEWFYLTVVVTKASSARTATVKAFVNGKPFEMGADAFGTNVNGNGCISFRMGDGVSCAGLRVDDTAVEDAATIVPWATDSRYVVEASATATWTGAAQDGDPTNANNWKYVSAAGEEIPGKLPDADTLVLLGGTLQFNATPSKTFECRAISFKSGVVLSADCDWTGLPVGFATGGYALDLAGHTLKLSLLGSGTITDTTTTAASPGSLVLDVAAEAILANEAMAIAGNLRLVKEGAGIYSCSVQQQAYAGGTVISNGTIRATDYEKFYYLGKQGTSITIEPNGTLDLYGWYDWQGHTLVLNGGTLANTRANMTQASWNAVGPVVLTADSKLNVTYDILFSSGSSVVDLGGYTLTAENPGTIQHSVYLNNTTFKNGTLLVEKNVRFKAMKATNAGAGFALVVNGDISMYTSDLTIESLTDNSQGNGEGAKVITVTKYFRPLSVYLANMTINDGVTIDLSSRTDPWSTRSAYADHAVGFASGATVTLNLDGRALTPGDKIVTWESQPDATFQWDSETAKKGVEPLVTGEGIYYGTYIATAVWTGALGDGDVTKPGNWTCTDSTGKTVSAIPTSATKVTIEGENLNVQIPDDLIWDILTVKASLGTACDWRGLGMTRLAAGSRIDLNGNDLKARGFMAQGAMTVTNSAAALSTMTFDIPVDTIYQNTLVAIGGNLKFVKEGGGTFDGRVASQLYTGGTVVNAGAITSNETETKLHWGVRDSDVLVEKNGVLDIKNNLSWCYHHIILNGGALKNTTGNETATAQGIGDVTLTADSKMLVNYHTTFKENDRKGVVDLGGHTLSIEYVERGPDDPKSIIYLNNTSWQNGTVIYGPSTVFRAYANCVFTDLKVVINGDIQLADINYTLMDLTDNSKGQFETYGKTITVTGVYKPLSPYLHNTTLNSGATLDLRDQEGAWEFTCKEGQNQTLTYASGATITVDLRGRTLTEGEKIIAWEAKPTNVTFQWDDETAKAGVEPRLEDDGLYYGIDGSDIDTALWTGGAGTGNYDATNPKNWQCTDFSKKVVQGAIPGDKSTLIVNIAPSKDVDWSVLGFVAFSADTRINLNGHSFTIAGFRTKEGVGAGATVDNDAAAATGDFIVNVAEGKTTENTTVTIAGNTRFVKEGAGTFIGKVQNQSYTGGTLVRAGTIQSSGSESKLFYGARVSTMTVDPDGTLDVNGQYDWNNHDIVLNGGTLSNSGGHQTQYTYGGIGNMSLTADSKMELKYHILFNRSAGATLDLGGCTLSVTRVNSSDNILFTLESKHIVTNGTLVCGNNIRFFTRGSGVNLTDTKLDLNYSWRKNYAITAYDLTCNLVTSEDDKQITVTGRFATNGNYDNVKLTDGSVLDLSGNTGALSTMSGISSRKLTFADEAAIAVDLADRTDLKQDMQVVSWTDATTPAESVTFTPKGAFYNLVRKADGLYLDRGVMTIFR